MNILTAHIVKEVLKGSFFALLLLLTLFNLFTFSDELKDLGHGNYGLKQIFLYLALISPRMMYELVPSAALLGSLFVLGAMANNREIVAMRASGLSVLWIIRSVMLAGVVLVIFALLIGEFVAPTSERSARLLKTTAENNKVIMHSQYGIWLREGNQFVNIREIDTHSELGNITLYQIDDQHRLSQVTHAQSGVYQNNEKSWQLQNLKKTELLADGVKTAKTEAEIWRSSIEPDLLNVAAVNANNLSLRDLSKRIDFLKQNNQKTQDFEAAFWGRLINPLVTFVMLMVATPFVISIKRGSSMGSRLMIGVIIGMSFNIIDSITAHAGLVYQLNPLLMAILPSSVVFIAATYAVSRMK